MNELSSAQFRKVYARLTEPTTVTVNGHPIGRWLPTSAFAEMEWSRISNIPEHIRATEDQRDEYRRDRHSGKSPQQARDDLLSKINRGKR